VLNTSLLASVVIGVAAWAVLVACLFRLQLRTWSAIAWRIPIACPVGIDEQRPSP
jgi:hypothetical protein